MILPPELVRARRTKDQITPILATEEKASLAKTMISVYTGCREKRRGELAEQVTACEELGYDYKLVRGLAFVLDGLCTFTSRSAAAPATVRPLLFAEAARTPVYSEADRAAVVARVAKKLGVDPADIDEGMYADLEEEQVLVDFRKPEPTDLLGYYNHSLASAVLTYAHRIVVEYSGKSPEVERAAAALGDPDIHGSTGTKITVELKPLKQVAARGAKAEALLSALITTKGWSLAADVAYPAKFKETRPLALNWRSHTDLLKAEPRAEEIVIEVKTRPEKRSSYGEVVVIGDTANLLGITDKELLKLIDAEGAKYVKLGGVAYAPSTLEAIKAELEGKDRGELPEFKRLLKGHGVSNPVAVLESLGYIVEPGEGKAIRVYRLRRRASSI